MDIVKPRFDNGLIHNMTYKWLSSAQNPLQITEFYMLTKINKNTLSANQLFLVAATQQNTSSVLLPPFYNRLLKTRVIN